MFPEAADGNSTVKPGVKSLVKPVAGETKPAESPRPVIEVLAGLGATGGRPRSVSVEMRGALAPLAKQAEGMRSVYIRGYPCLTRECAS